MADVSSRKAFLSSLFLFSSSLSRIYVSFIPLSLFFFPFLKCFDCYVCFSARFFFFSSFLLSFFPSFFILHVTVSSLSFPSLLHSFTPSLLLSFSPSILKNRIKLFLLSPKSVIFLKQVKIIDQMFKDVC